MARQLPTACQGLGKVNRIFNRLGTDRFVEKHGGDIISMRLRLWLDRVFVLARGITTLANKTVKDQLHKPLRDLNAILVIATDCKLATELLGQIRHARDQLLTFCDFPGNYATNNVSERALRPSVIQHRVVNGYRAKWAADADAAMRTTVETARFTGANPYRNVLTDVSA